MLNKIFTLVILLALGLPLAAQVTCEPVFPTLDDNVTITFTASEGNGALASTPPPIFAHMGLITNLSTSGTDWKHVKTQWGVNDPNGLMATTGTPGVYTKTFNIRQFFNVPANETVLRMAFVFRNTDGNTVGRASDGSDIFYPVYAANAGLQTAFLKPAEPSLFVQTGNQIAVKAAASQDASLSLLDNGQVVATATGKKLETTISAGAAGLHEVAFVAATATERDTAWFAYLVPAPVVTEALPAGTEFGITILNPQTVRLALYAPNKAVVHVIGDFSDWQSKPDFQMKKTPDGSTWWLDIPATPGQPLRFQYLVDGQLKIADPYSTLVLDPWNDGFIPALTFPNLVPYPSGKTTGIVSLVETGQAPFNWQSNNYVRPKNTDLVVYELLMRDFIQRHDYQTLLDTLDYLQKLGITAIELMPVNEFDGNTSWGYNPAFHKALDKYYGSPEAFKTFVDECHSRGIAVILDVVFNHATGASPLAQLYWDAANNRPAANNPWLNPTAKHDFNVFNDFNHESAQTKIYVRNCLRYWLDEYRVDGFRFDLSKGFTQKNTVGNIGAWGAYDASRIAILKDYANTCWAAEPGSYVILEHFADNNEEKELANYGMMLWGNNHFAFKEVALGFPSGANQSFTGLSYKQRQFNDPHLIGYMESHDEERIGYECKVNGNNYQGYNVKSLPTALARQEMLNTLFYTVPGPKMLWEFGELGYDYSINYCVNGTINSNCRLDPKPIRWDYLQQPQRRHLHDQMLALLHLRNTEDVFETTDFQIIMNTAGRGRIVKLNSPTVNVHAIANTDVIKRNIPGSFQHGGLWYDYFTGNTRQVTGLTDTLSLQPGEYRLYIDKFVPLPPGIDLSVGTSDISGELESLQVFPNPTAQVLNLVFNLKKSGAVRIELFDLTGRRLQILADQTLPAGEQFFQTSLDAPPGIYFVKISEHTGGGLLTRKVIKH